MGWKNLNDPEVDAYLGDVAAGRAGMDPRLQAKARSKAMRDPRFARKVLGQMDEVRAGQERVVREQEMAARAAEREAAGLERERVMEEARQRARDVRWWEAQGAKIQTDIETGKRDVVRHPDGRVAYEPGPVGWPEFLGLEQVGVKDAKTGEARVVPDVSVMTGGGGGGAAGATGLSRGGVWRQKVRDDRGREGMVPVPTETDKATGEVYFERKNPVTGLAERQVVGMDRQVMERAARAARLEQEKASHDLAVNVHRQEKGAFDPEWSVVRNEYEGATKELEGLQGRFERRGSWWVRISPETGRESVATESEVSRHQAKVAEAKGKIARVRDRYERMAPAAERIEKADAELRRRGLKLDEERIRIEAGLPEEDGGLAAALVKEEGGGEVTGQHDEAMALVTGGAPLEAKPDKTEDTEEAEATDPSLPTEFLGMPLKNEVAAEAAGIVTGAVKYQPLLGALPELEAAGGVKEALGALNGLENLGVEQRNTYTALHDASGAWIASVEDGGNGSQVVVLEEAGRMGPGIAKAVNFGDKKGAPLFLADNRERKDIGVIAREVGEVWSAVDDPELRETDGTLGAKFGERMKELGATPDAIKAKVDGGLWPVQWGEAVMKNLWGGTLKPDDVDEEENFQKYLVERSTEEGKRGVPPDQTIGARWTAATKRGNKGWLLTGFAAPWGTTYSLSEQDQIRMDYYRDWYQRNRGKPGVTRAKLQEMMGRKSSAGAGVMARAESASKAWLDIIRYDAGASMLGMGAGLGRDASAGEVALLGRLFGGLGKEAAKQAGDEFFESMRLRNRDWANFLNGTERNIKKWTTPEGKARAGTLKRALITLAETIDAQADLPQPDKAAISAAQAEVRDAALALHQLAPDENWPIKADDLDADKDAALGNALARYFASGDPRDFQLYRDRLLMSNGRRQYSAEIERKVGELAGRHPGKFSRQFFSAMHVGWQEFAAEMVADAAAFVTGGTAKGAQAALRVAGKAGSAARMARLAGRVGKTAEAVMRLGLSERALARIAGTGGGLAKPVTALGKVRQAGVRTALAAPMAMGGEGMEGVLVEFGADSPQFADAFIKEGLGGFGFTPMIAAQAAMGGMVAEKRAEGAQLEANGRFASDYNRVMAGVAGFEPITRETAGVARQFIDPVTYESRATELARLSGQLRELAASPDATEAQSAAAAQMLAHIDARSAELAEQAEAAVGAATAIEKMEPAQRTFHVGVAKVATGNQALLTRNERAAIAGARTADGAAYFADTVRADGKVESVLTDEGRAEVQMNAPEVGALIRTTESAKLVEEAVRAQAAPQGEAATAPHQTAQPSPGAEPGPFTVQVLEGGNARVVDAAGTVYWEGPAAGAEAERAKVEKESAEPMAVMGRALARLEAEKPSLKGKVAFSDEADAPLTVVKDRVITISRAKFAERLAKSSARNRPMAASAFLAKVVGTVAKAEARKAGKKAQAKPVASKTEKPAAEKPSATEQQTFKAVVQRIIDGLRKNETIKASIKFTNDPKVLAAYQYFDNNPGRILINPKRMMEEIRANKLTTEAGEAWIAKVIDEEIRHKAQHDAGVVMWKNAGAPGEFLGWFQKHYKALWNEQFKRIVLDDEMRKILGDRALPEDKTLADVVLRIYGTDLGDHRMALEGIRMLSQITATGEATEIGRLWAKLSQRIKEELRAYLDALKALVRNLAGHPELDAEVKALERELKKYEAGNLPEATRKPPTKEAPDEEAQRKGQGLQVEPPAEPPAGETAVPAATAEEATPAVEPPQNDVQNTAAQPKQSTTGKIEDFGEKLGGARKDQQASIARDISDSDIASLPLSKIWSKSEVDSIEDIPLAAFAHTLRDSIPNKPKNAYKLGKWVASVKAARSLMRSVQDGSLDEVVKRIIDQDRFISILAYKAIFLRSIPRYQWGRIGEVNNSPDAYTYASDGKTRIPSPTAYAYVDGKYVVSANLDALVDVVKERLGTGKKQTDIKFEIRQNSRTGQVFVNKHGDPLRRKLKTFETVEDARTYMREKRQELVDAWELVKEQENIKETDVRAKENRPRTGKNHRNGRDATPEMFMSAFGFRGVEFGNWVAQGKNAKERQGMLDQAYDALLDLADIIGVPSRALSLNGTLGLAFGSRGHGWASAHFEPHTMVINMTKPRGAGNLAHEWFHALDNYFSRKRSGGDVKDEYRRRNFITNQPESHYVDETTGFSLTKARFAELRTQGRIHNPGSWKLQDGVRHEVEESFAELVKALDNSPMAKRAAKIDKGQSSGYWSRIIERAARSFENYIIAKMQLLGYQNDYLANVVSVEDFVRDKGSYPYLLADELSPVTEAFDDLFATIKSRGTENGVELYAASITPAQDAEYLELAKEPEKNRSRLQEMVDEAARNSSSVVDLGAVERKVNQAEDFLRSMLDDEMQRHGISRIDESKFVGLEPYAPYEEGDGIDDSMLDQLSVREYLADKHLSPLEWHAYFTRQLDRTSRLLDWLASDQAVQINEIDGTLSTLAELALDLDPSGEGIGAPPSVRRRSGKPSDVDVKQAGEQADWIDTAIRFFKGLDKTYSAFRKAQSTAATSINVYTHQSLKPGEFILFEPVYSVEAQDAGLTYDLASEPRLYKYEAGSGVNDTEIVWRFWNKRNEAKSALSTDSEFKSARDGYRNLKQQMRNASYTVDSISEGARSDLPPVTYDSQGNVIPLSQRFNPESPSILYAAPLKPSGSEEPTPERQAVMLALEGMPPIHSAVFAQAAKGVGRGAIAKKYGIPETAVDNILNQVRARVDVAMRAVGNEGLKPAMREGKLAGGRPDLALSTIPEVAAVDQARNEAGVTGVVSDEWVDSEAEKLLSKDYRGTYDMLLAKARRQEQFTLVETAAAKKIVARETLGGRARTNEEAVRLAVFIGAYRDVRGEAGRILRIGKDPHRTPAERAARFLSEMMFTPDEETRARIAQETPEQREVSYAKWVERVNVIKRRLKERGIDIDGMLEEYAERKRLREEAEKRHPETAAGVSERIERLSPVHRAVVEAIRDGARLTRAAMIGGISVDEARKVWTSFRGGVIEFMRSAAKRFVASALKAAGLEPSVASILDELHIPSIEDIDDTAPGWKKRVEARERRAEKAGTEAGEPGRRRRKSQVGDLSDPLVTKEAGEEFARERAMKMDSFIELWRMSILTGPQTALVNIGSNLAFSVWNLLPRRLAEATVNSVAGWVGMSSKQDATFGEFLAMAKNLRIGFALASRNALRSWQLNDRVFEKYALSLPMAPQAEPSGASIMKGERMKAPPPKNWYGKILHDLSYRQMTAADEWMKSLHGQFEAAAQAHRIARVEEGLRGEAYARRVTELMIPGSEAWKRSLREGKRVTYQEELAPGNPRMIHRLDQLAELAKRGRAMPWIGRPLTFFMPFIDTPLNIFKQAVQMSPLGTFLAVVDGARALDILVRRGKLTKEQARAKAAMLYDRARLVRDITDQTLAWMVYFALAGLVAPDEDDETGLPHLTGTVPYRTTRRGERETTEVVMPAYTIRIGRTQFSYMRIDPFATMLAGLIDLLVEIDRNAGKMGGQVASNYIMRLKDQVKDKTFLQGISDLINAIEDPDRFAENAAANIVTGLAPNLIRQSLREVDPVMRETRPRSSDGFFSGLLRTMRYKVVPQLAPPRLDAWGRPLPRRRGAMIGGTPVADAIFRVLDPTNLSIETRADPLDLYIFNWNLKAPDPRDKLSVEAIPDYITATVDGRPVKIPLTEEERFEANRRAGQAAKEILGWKWDWRRPDQSGINRIRTIVRSVQSNERARLRAAKLPQFMAEQRAVEVEAEQP